MKHYLILSILLLFISAGLKHSNADWVEAKFPNRAAGVWEHYILNAEAENDIKKYIYDLNASYLVVDTVFMDDERRKQVYRFNPGQRQKVFRHKTNGIYAMLVQPVSEQLEAVDGNALTLYVKLISRKKIKCSTEIWQDQMMKLQQPDQLVEFVKID